MDPQTLMREYEQASRDQDLERVLACIDPNAVYWFSNESCHVGKPAIAEAIRSNFEVIEAEDYRIQDLNWRVLTEQSAVCTYRYVWSGIIRGQSASGAFRGTSVLARQDKRWLLLHEHLSKGPAC